MSSRKSAFVAACAMVSTVGSAVTVNAAESPNKLAERTIGVAAQFKPIFNGRNLDGWKHVGPGKFEIENGVLKTVGGMGLLWYTGEKIGNSVVRIVYKAPDDNGGGNSGGNGNSGG